MNSIEEVKGIVANGKNLIGGVVGGNQDSTFQVLANNAQSIKNERDNKLSQVNNLNAQVNSLSIQITNMTNDRNNWMNIANSRYIITNGISPFSVVMNGVNGNLFVINNSSIVDMAGYVKIENNQVCVQFDHPKSYSGYREYPLNVPATVEDGAYDREYWVGMNIRIIGDGRVEISDTSNWKLRYCMIAR